MNHATLYIETERKITKEDAEQILKIITAYFTTPEMIRGCE
jgi:hypothetical protein